MNIIYSVLAKKATLSGIAIILVILVHLNLFGESRFLPGILSLCLVGVDFFFLLSGYSLGYSLKKNAITSFYKKRIKRVYPLFFVFATLSTFLFLYEGEKVDFTDYLFNITTLSYYGIGGQRVDWYLSSLFVFYGFYPLCYWAVQKYKYWAMFVILAITFFLIGFIQIPWQYSCAISRLPIFCFGIVLYVNKEEKGNIDLRSIFLTFLFFFLFSLLLIYKRIGVMHGYYALDLATPFIFMVLVFLLNRMNFHSRIVDFMGRNTLEIYIANYLTLSLTTLVLVKGDYTRLVIYLFLNAIFAIALIGINTLLGIIADTLSRRYEDSKYNRWLR